MEFAKKLVGNDERAVSPVIGVILMVAITVILAAVIAAFVLDLGSGLESGAQAGVNVEGDGSSEVTVTVESLANADEVQIRDSSGNDVETLDKVGAKHTLDSSDAGTSADDYSVVALQEGQGETIVATFELT